MKKPLPLRLVTWALRIISTLPAVGCKRIVYEKEQEALEGKWASIGTNVGNAARDFNVL